MKRPPQLALRAAIAFTFIVSCGSGSDVPDSEAIALDATPDPSGPGFTGDGTHFTGCEDFCAKDWFPGSTKVVSCDGPVPVDPSTGVAKFYDGGRDMVIYWNGGDAGRPNDAVLCEGTFHNAPGCGVPVTSTGMTPETGP